MSEHSERTPRWPAAILAAAACALLAAGCGAVGDVCTADDDCAGSLRCTARDGARGICTYPEGIVTDAVADASPVDAPGEVSAGQDSGTDVSPAADATPPADAAGPGNADGGDTPGG